MTCSPTELWAEIGTLAVARAAIRRKINADLKALPDVPSEWAIEAHMQRCNDLYVELVSLGEKAGVLIDLMAERGLVDEICAYLAVTYGGRP